MNFSVYKSTYFRNKHQVVNAVLQALSSIDHAGIGCLPSTDKDPNHPATHQIVIVKENYLAGARVMYVGLVMDEIRALPEQAFSEYLVELLLRTEEHMKSGNGAYKRSTIDIDISSDT